MNLKHLGVAVGVALSSSAHAYVNNEVDHGNVTLLPGNQVEGFYTAPLNLGDMFEDYHYFSVSLPSAGTGVLSNKISINPNGSFNKVIAGLSAYLYQDLGVAGDFSDDGVGSLITELGLSGSPIATKTPYFIADAGPLPTGNYFIKVSGFGAGTSGGEYSFFASALPVPEANTWGMMAVGLGLVGLQLRRRAHRGAGKRAVLV